MKIAQQFIAGMQRDYDNQSAKRTTENGLLQATSFQSSVSRTEFGKPFVTPAINRWAILDRPLRGLAVFGPCHGAFVSNLVYPTTWYVFTTSSDCISRVLFVLT